MSITRRSLAEIAPIATVALTAEVAYLFAVPTQRGRWLASLLFVTIVGCGHHEGDHQPRFETLADAPALGGEAFGIAVDAAGNVYFADPTHARIGRIDGATRAVTTVAGGRNGFCGDGGPALDACFRDVTDVAVDRDGNLYVADRGDEDLGAARSQAGSA